MTKTSIRLEEELSYTGFKTVTTKMSFGKTNKPSKPINLTLKELDSLFELETYKTKK